MTAGLHFEAPRRDALSKANLKQHVVEAAAAGDSRQAALRQPLQQFFYRSSVLSLVLHDQRRAQGAARRLGCLPRVVRLLQLHVHQVAQLEGVSGGARSRTAARTLFTWPRVVESLGRTTLCPVRRRPSAAAVSLSVAFLPASPRRRVTTRQPLITAVVKAVARQQASHSAVEHVRRYGVTYMYARTRKVRSNRNARAFARLKHARLYLPLGTSP